MLDLTWLGYRAGLGRVMLGYRAGLGWASQNNVFVECKKLKLDSSLHSKLFLVGVTITFNELLFPCVSRFPVHFFSNFPVFFCILPFSCLLLSCSSVFFYSPVLRFSCSPAFPCVLPVSCFPMLSHVFLLFFLILLHSPFSCVVLLSCSPITVH